METSAIALSVCELNDRIMRLNPLALELSSAPYPGLRPFSSSEADVFFGREHQTDQLLERLAQHRFLAVLGPSGCGKSSLVEAGMRPALASGFMVGAGSHWRVAYLRPGKQPLRNLAEALMQVGVMHHGRDDHDAARSKVETTLRRGPLGLVELACDSKLEPDENLLLLVDQFEELFRFAATDATEETSVAQRQHEAAAFVSLLLASAAAAHERIYVTITMRSDYLGQCAMFRGLPEAINDGLYLTPRLTRDECASCITSPARVFGGDVEPLLVNRLLNDFGPDPDQLPLLQHALLRMWNCHDQAESESGKIVLTLLDYERIGGLAAALSQHADAILSKLSAEDQRLAELIFRRLTDLQSGRRDQRAPATVAQIARFAGTNVDAVIRVADAFRCHGCCFLTPRDDVVLGPDSVIDVGHESILRQWDTAARWIKEEEEVFTLYRRLQQAAQDWDSEQGALWRGPGLERAVEWRTKIEAIPGWPMRYAGASQLEAVLRFLRESERAQGAERKRQSGVRLRRILAYTVTSAALLLVHLMVLHRYLYVWERVAFHASVQAIQGVPKGTLELTPEQVRARTMSYRVVTAGRLGAVKRMYAVNGRGSGTNDPSAGEFAERAPTYHGPAEARGLKASLWVYSYDADGELQSELEYTRNRQLVHGKIYVRRETNGSKDRIAYFIGPDGTPTIVRGVSEDSAYYWAERYTTDGRTQTTQYLGEVGQRVPGNDRAWATKGEYDERGRLLALISLDSRGNKMRDSYGNAVMRTKYDSKGDAIEDAAYDENDKPTLVDDGWSTRRVVYDSNHNVTEESYYDVHGAPTMAKGGWHRRKFVRDEHGRDIEAHHFDVSGRPSADSEGCHRYAHEFDELDRLRRRTCQAADGSKRKHRGGSATELFRYDRDGRYEEISYLDVFDRPVHAEVGYAAVHMSYDENGRGTRIRYWGPDGRMASNKQGYAEERTSYVKNRERTSYFDADGRPVVIAGGYAILEQERDIFGNVIQRSYLDASGHPVRSSRGYTALRSTFDAQGRQVETSYRGETGEVVLGKDGYAGWRTEFDELGRSIETHYLGLSGEPIATIEQGIAGWTTGYDAWDNEISRRYFDVSGNITLTFQGEAGWNATFDALGNELEREYVDKAGHPTLHAWDQDKRFAGGGYAVLAQRFDQRGRLVESSYLGTNRQPILNPERWSRVVHTLSDDGHQLRSAYFDANGPTRTLAGFAVVARDFADRVVDIHYLDVDHQTLIASSAGYARVVKTLDARGQWIEQATFGAQGERVAGGDGAHRNVAVRNTRDEIIRVEDFGTDAEPNLLRVTEYDYDSWGNPAEERHLDARRAPVASKDQPCAVLRWTHSARQELLRQECRDGQRLLFAGLEQGAAAIVYGYDRRGGMTTQQYNDSSDEPFATEYGYAAIRYQCDSLGRQIEATYHDANGARVDTDLGFARTTYSYDPQGNLAVQSFFDANDAPVRPVSKIVSTFDSARLKQRERFYGPSDKPARLAGDGQHETVYKHDEFGKLIELSYRDKWGQPTRGYAGQLHDEQWRLCGRWKVRYEQGGNLRKTGECEWSLDPT